MELGTYSQGEYIPRKIEKQKVLGSTVLEFSSREDGALPPYDTTIIRVIEDPELNPSTDNEATADQASYMSNRNYYSVLRALKKLSGRTTKQSRKFN